MFGSSTVSLPSWVVVLLALFPSVGAAAAAVVVSSAQHRHERAEWKRNTRFETYAKFAESAGGLALLAFDFICEPPTVGSHERVNAAVRDCAHAVSKVVFVGPSAVSAKALELNHALGELTIVASQWDGPRDFGTASNVPGWNRITQLTGEYEALAARQFGRS